VTYSNNAWTWRRHVNGLILYNEIKDLVRSIADNWLSDVKVLTEKLRGVSLRQHDDPPIFETTCAEYDWYDPENVNGEANP
jgi:uncharacterized protein with von Willebrand factor type A (vWA) domain